MTNKAPIVYNPIKNQIYDAVIDELFKFEFSLNTFSDEDDKFLTYTAEQANGDTLP